MPASAANELLDKALKRHKELVDELEALTRFIEDYSQIVRSRESVSNFEQPELFQPQSKRVAHADRVAEMMDAARRIILSEQRPMKRGELRKRVESLGFEIVGRDKNKVFGTNLWRSGKFLTVEGQGYWPTDVELPR
ncbi:MAG: hypothetical protein V4808_01360 [Pseudomonadota bacterium]